MGPLFVCERAVCVKGEEALGGLSMAAGRPAATEDATALKTSRRNELAGDNRDRED